MNTEYLKSLPDKTLLNTLQETLSHPKYENNRYTTLANNMIKLSVLSIKQRNFIISHILHFWEKI